MCMLKSVHGTSHLKFQSSKEKIMCCDGWDKRVDGVVYEFCSTCGEEIDEDGNAVCGCCWTIDECPDCGSRPCHGAC
jgi:predicted Rossmann-fold nucleotide-binding protein